MKHSFFVIILLAVAGLVAACGNTAVQPAPAAAEAAPAVAVPQTDTLAQSTGSQVDTVVDEALPASEPQPAPLVFEPQLNNENAVTVEITPLNLPDGGGPTLDFEVAFNTHSVDLSFDPAAISVLRDDAGREYQAVAWEGDGPGGHHRAGVLRFNVPETASTFIEVIIHDVAGVPERVFQWNLTQS